MTDEVEISAQVLKNNGFVKMGTPHKWMRRKDSNVLTIWERNTGWTIDFLGARNRYKLQTKIQFVDELKLIFKVLDIGELK